MPLLSVLEHETVIISDDPVAGVKSLTVAKAEQLRKIESTFPPKTINWGHKTLKLSHYCGVISIGNLTLEILPKIYGLEEQPGASRDVLVSMLYRAKILKPAVAGNASMALQRHSLLDIFVILFCQQLQKEVLQGLIRQYIEHNENLNVLRGRLRTEQQFKFNLHRPERLYCQYDELSEDNLSNQVIKYALLILSKIPMGNQAHKQVLELLMRFDHVTSIEVSRYELDNLNFDRMSQRYLPILEQCRLIIDGYHPDVVAGNSAGISLLFDMNRLFESYVSADLRRWAWSNNLRLRTQGPQRYLAHRLDTDQDVFLMKPDITLLDKENQIVMILDAKWKVLDSEDRKIGISQTDLYQMLSYATQYGCRKLALIYPHQMGMLEMIDLQFLVGGVDLRIIPWHLSGTNQNDFSLLFSSGEVL